MSSRVIIQFLTSHCSLSPVPQMSDPRRPSLEREVSLRTEEAFVGNWLGFLAMLGSLVAMWFRRKELAYASLLAHLASFAQLRLQVPNLRLPSLFIPQFSSFFSGSRFQEHYDESQRRNDVCLYNPDSTTCQIKELIHFSINSNYESSLSLCNRMLSTMAFI